MKNNQKDINIEVSLSEITENDPVGTITYYSTNETIPYYSEQELFNHYKSELYNIGPLSCSYNLTHNETNERLALRFQLTKTYIGQYGETYTKEDFFNDIKNEKKIPSNEHSESIQKCLDDKDLNKLIHSLREGVSDFLSSDQFKNYLDFCSSFYNYSVNNTVLISKQKPDATFIGSYNFWKSKGRHVKKGEKAIKIMAPSISKRKVTDIVKDINGNPTFDKDGRVKTHEVNQTVVSGFRLVSVFDISQTEGKPIPTLLNELTGSSEISKALTNAITQISTIPITYEVLSYNGYFDRENRKIVISNHLDDNQKAKTLIHEYTHSRLHERIKDYSFNRGKYEIEAESTAYVVSKHFGLDTSEYSFGYLSYWSKGKGLDEYQESLKLVQSISKEIITDITTVLSKEQEKEQKKEKQEIKKELDKHQLHSTDHMVDCIYALNHISNKKHSIDEIKKLAKNVDLIKDNSIKDCVKNILSAESKPETIIEQKTFELER
ncbi:MAG: ArdC-like ssDNA-binding domain-containing protein [Bacteroidales bacterium]|nr:ArdC-like ssDNA-binding domain-containing protein [Bacteroidales bacterium]